MDEAIPPETSCSMEISKNLYRNMMRSVEQQVSSEGNSDLGWPELHCGCVPISPIREKETLQRHNAPWMSLRRVLVLGIKIQFLLSPVSICKNVHNSATKLLGKIIFFVSSLRCTSLVRITRSCWQFPSTLIAFWAHLLIYSFITDY